MLLSTTTTADKHIYLRDWGGNVTGRGNVLKRLSYTEVILLGDEMKRTVTLNEKKKKRFLWIQASLETFGIT